MSLLLSAFRMTRLRCWYLTGGGISSILPHQNIYGFCTDVCPSSACTQHITPVLRLDRSFCSRSTESDCKAEDINSVLISSDHKKLLSVVCEDMNVIIDFISEEEEQLLFEEIDPYISRKKYQSDHWDDAIHGYRETEKSRWRQRNREVLTRVQKAVFRPGDTSLVYTHVLDLAPHGYIKPHVDAIKFCGNCISGVSLLSDSVMRLRKDADRKLFADVMLPRRSLYIMRDRVRYDFAHELLAEAESYFKGQFVARDRRISIISRNEPCPVGLQ